MCAVLRFRLSITLSAEVAPYFYGHLWGDWDRSIEEL